MFYRFCYSHTFYIVEPSQQESRKSKGCRAAENLYVNHRMSYSERIKNIICFMRSGSKGIATTLSIARRKKSYALTCNITLSIIWALLTVRMHTGILRLKAHIILHELTAWCERFSKIRKRHTRTYSNS